jgi:ADP-ribosyl-[dinitrogen reductase] hydrolase
MADDFGQEARLESSRNVRKNVMARRIDKDRMKGALLGLAVGDPEGADTQMAMALAESLVDLGGYDPNDALRRYVSRHEGGVTAPDPTSSVVLDAISGGATAADATRHHDAQEGNSSATAGALLRSTPIAMAFAGNESSIRDATLADAALTHYDPIVGKAAVFHNHLISVEVTAGHDTAFAEMAQPELHIDDRIDDALVPAVSGSRYYAERLSQEQPTWVVAALAVGLAAVFTAPSFEDGIEWALGLEGNTNASAAGALLGARFGAGAISEERLARVPDRGRLEGLAGYLTTMAGG